MTYIHKPRHVRILVLPRPCADPDPDILRPSLASTGPLYNTTSFSAPGVLPSICTKYHSPYHHHCLFQQISEWRLALSVGQLLSISGLLHHENHYSLLEATRTACRSPLESYQLASTACSVSGFHLPGGIIARCHQSARTRLLCACPSWTLSTSGPSWRLMVSGSSCLGSDSIIGGC